MIDGVGIKLGVLLGVAAPVAEGWTDAVGAGGVPEGTAASVIVAVTDPDAAGTAVTSTVSVGAGEAVGEAMGAWPASEEAPELASPLEEEDPAMVTVAESVSLPAFVDVSTAVFRHVPGASASANTSRKPAPGGRSPMLRGNWEGFCSEHGPLIESSRTTPKAVPGP